MSSYVLGPYPLPEGVRATLFQAFHAVIGECKVFAAHRSLVTSKGARRVQDFIGLSTAQAARKKCGPKNRTPCHACKDRQRPDDTARCQTAFIKVPPSQTPSDGCKGASGVRVQSRRGEVGVHKVLGQDFGEISSEVCALISSVCFFCHCWFILGSHSACGAEDVCSTKGWKFESYDEWLMAPQLQLYSTTACPR